VVDVVRSFKMLVMTCTAKYLCLTTPCMFITKIAILFYSLLLQVAMSHPIYVM
jgi:hypothetical protein